MDLDDELEAKKSSNKGTLIAFALVLVVGAVVGIFMRKHMKTTERDHALHDAATAWNGLQKCLIGAPLAAGENATQRLHRVEVNRDPVVAGGTATDVNDRWPYRCTVYSTNLRDAASALEPGDAAMHRLRAAAERVRGNLVRGQIETGALRTHEATAVDALWEAAAPVQLPPPANYTGPAAPPVSSMLVREG
ncbi:MAG: hypothetical protein WCJ30_25020, partial [Deltaproteobacteria bacterium]